MLILIEFSKTSVVKNSQSQTSTYQLVSRIALNICIYFIQEFYKPNASYIL